jgi:D-cysteine desulfhydrase
LSAVLVLRGDPPDRATGNLVLDGLLGASIVWAGDEDLDAVADRVVSDLRGRGRRPARIPFGGSNATGAHGYRLAGEEILDQLPSVDHVVCALGSGGTMAGLVCALRPSRVLGVHVGAVQDPRARVGALLAEMALTDVDAAELRIDLGQVGDGYSTLAPGARRALLLAAHSEGLVLDPIYSARALAGLTAALEVGTISSSRNIVFLASGGAPGLFGNSSAVELGTAGTNQEQT